jgi:uncharacterized protein
MGLSTASRWTACAAALLVLGCAGAPGAPRVEPAAAQPPPVPGDPGELQAQLRGNVPGGVLSELPPERADLARHERETCAGQKRVLGQLACVQRAEQYAQGTGGVARDAGLAAALLEQSCALGHWQSCARLGLVLAEGDGVRASPERSAQLYWLACANGPVPAACLNLGLQYATGEGVQQSDALAATYYERACQGLNAQGCRNLEALQEAQRQAALAPERAAQVPNASFRALPPEKAARVRPDLLKCFDLYSRTHCNNLGVDYARGLEVARDEAIAAAFFEQACQLGEATACTNLTSAALAARAHHRPLATADAVLSRACDEGQAVACSELGVQALASARPEDDARARRLLTRACAAQQAMACTNLGWMYERGRGVRADAARAGGLYAKGCAAGVALACRNQAVLQARGARSRAELSAAAQGYARACDGGERRACASLASLHAQGVGTPREQARSAAWLERSCREGERGACVYLGQMHQYGNGVARDSARALALYEGACRAGAAEACVRAADLLQGTDALADAGHVRALQARACTLGLASACEPPGGNGR